jgi:PAS domain S-box-containing protein
MKNFSKFNTIYIPRVADLPPEASVEREILQSQRIQSLIIVPMVYGRSLVGYLGFDSVRVEKIWPEEIITLLKIVGEIFVNALEHKRLEEELESSRAYFRDFFNSSPVPLTLIGLDGKRLDCNPAMEELTGRRREELVGVPVEEVYPEEEQELVRKKLVDETIGKGSVYDFETYFLRLDGTKLPIIVNTALIRDKDDKPSSIIYSATDTSELKKREEEVKEAKETKESFERATARIAASIVENLRKMSQSDTSELKKREEGVKEIGEYLEGEIARIAASIVENLRRISQRSQSQKEVI